MMTQDEAENMAAIAVDSKRDSTAMKAVAVLGMFFLPGIFVITFGMIKSDWNPSNGAPIMSGFISMHLFISIPLTLLFMLLLLFLSLRESQRRLKNTAAERSSSALKGDKGWYSFGN